MAIRSGLGTTVLRDVSRSFYLSLRFLPQGFREPASVGYLLARLSDTIADAGGASLETRLELLEQFKTSFSVEGLKHLKDISQGESVLVNHAGECVEAMLQLPDWQEDAVRKVVGIITDGQSWDLTRFQGEGTVRLENEEELLGYTYQVAGCVGEFWTELGFGLGDFSSESREQMMEWGRSYGRSLQLINILRDEEEDAEIGRCYFPDDDRDRWLILAHSGLTDAEKYCHALYGRRMRFATWLPLLIGRETLDLLGKSDHSKVKISRLAVKRLMGVAAGKALFAD